MRELVKVIGGAVMLGGFLYALYQDNVVGPKEWEAQKKECLFPKILPHLERLEDGKVQLNLEIETGLQALTIEGLEVCYGTLKWHMDFLRPHLEDHESFSPLGEPERLLGDQSVEIPPQSRKCFSCILNEPPDLPASQHSSGAGWSSGRKSGIRVLLQGSRERSMMLSLERS